MEKLQFNVTGMSCAACSAKVEKTVAKLVGVAAVAVNLLKNTMTVEFDSGKISADDIISAVAGVGYGAELAVDEKDGSRKASNAKSEKSASTSGGTASKGVKSAEREMKIRLIVSFVFTIPLFYLSMGSMIGLPIPSIFLGAENAMTFAFAQLLLAVPVVCVNFKYFKNGFTALFKRSPNMDTLIAVGSSAAMLYGVYAIFRIGYALGHGDLHAAHEFSMNLYFESAVMILSLITLGKFFETRAKGKTTSAIEKLLDLTPKTAVIVKDGNMITVSADEVVAGDILAVKAGETVPVDGVVTEGYAAVDEAMITGESMPVEKVAGDKVTGATISVSGYFLMRAEAVGADTALAKIIRLVDDATSSKAPAQRLADKISGVFVPIVMGIALVAFVVWLSLGYGFSFALTAAISVLVISCPCALGLATPTAIMVGMGKGASKGILIKSAESLEAARGIDTVVFDKTGTLTEGKPVVTDMIIFDAANNRFLTESDVKDANSEYKNRFIQLLSVAAALEKKSSHPLAVAILEKAEKEGVSYPIADEFEMIPGRGISGRLSFDGGKTSGMAFAGNVRLMNDAGIDVSLWGEVLENLASDGKTPLMFALGGECVGVIAAEDRLKPSCVDAIKQLEKMNVDVYMLTGDNQKTALAVAKRAGIKHVFSEVLPHEKEAKIRELKDEGRRVAMVGDGINDAPALVRADVGIAVGAGTDVAMESADIVLMKSDLSDVVTALKLSRAVIRNVKQNLFWAFFYNSVGIPVAAGVFYGVWKVMLSPMIAAGAMSLSSVTVVLNALRLRFWGDKKEKKVAKKVNEIAESDSLVSISNELTCDCGDNCCAIENCDLKENDLDAEDLACDLENKEKEGKNNMKTLKIEGMMCNHCKASVEKALLGISGVSAAVVDLDAKTAVITCADGVLDNELIAAVENAGYSAEML